MMNQLLDIAALYASLCFVLAMMLAVLETAAHLDVLVLRNRLRKETADDVVRYVLP